MCTDPEPRYSYHGDAGFPLLNTFPNIYESDVRTNEKKAEVRAALGTSKRTAFWSQQMESDTRWLVGREEREEFCNGLHQIREAYVEDYDSLDEEWDE